MKNFVLKCLGGLLAAMFALFGNSCPASAEAGGISAASAVVIEADSGRVVYEKNAYERRPMASTTKIMTTMLALEQDRFDLDEYFVVDSQAIKVEGSSMGLQEGDKVTLRTLCYGMMLPSGNDAANATAVKLAGSIENFAELMNERAAQIGLEDTHFVTPSGLDDYTDEHYSTAYDMAKLTAEALKNPDFAEICSSKTAKLNFGDPPYDRWLSNNNKLLKLCDGVFGVKTGFTDKARRCLVSVCKRDGVTLICVTLNAPDDWNDHAKLYDYAYSKVKSYALPVGFENVKVNVVGGNSDSVKAVFAETPSASLFDGELKNVECEILADRFYYAPIISGEELGRANFYLNGELIETVPLVAAQDVPVKEAEDSGVVLKYLKRILDIVTKHLRRG